MSHVAGFSPEPLGRADMGKALMIQGAGSNVGKSLVVAGQYRAARPRWLSVGPYTPQS